MSLIQSSVQGCLVFCFFSFSYGEPHECADASLPPLFTVSAAVNPSTINRLIKFFEKKEASGREVVD